VIVGGVALSIRRAGRGVPVVCLSATGHDAEDLPNSRTASPPIAKSSASNGRETAIPDRITARQVRLVTLNWSRAHCIALE